tara:strand:+ start:3713 stop:4336 length:624 start_codon:yes stop_codon:yes gene_type:complete
MKKLIFISFLFLSFVAFGQQTITKSIVSDAPYIELKTAGIDDLIIRESETAKLEITILNADLGILENVSCNDFNCVLSVTTSLKETNKLSTFKAIKVSAIVKIPKGKKVTVFGETINLKIEGYQGILRVFIDDGNIDIKKIKGITEIVLSSGNIYAQIADASLDIKTRKGSITFDHKIQKSPYRMKQHKKQRLIVKSKKANVVLTQL